MLYEALLSGTILLFIVLSVSQYPRAIWLLIGLLPTYLLRFPLFGIPTNLFEVLVGVTGLLGLAQPAVRAQWRYAWQALPLAIKVLTGIFVLACSLAVFIQVPCESWLACPAWQHSLGILKSWVIVPIVFAFIAFGLVKARTFTREQLLRPLIMSGVIVALIGLWQFPTVTRLASVYDVPNSLALFLTPLAIVAIWQGGCRNVLASLVMFIALIGTQSVGGLTALLSTLLLGSIWFAARSARRRYIILIALLSVISPLYLYNQGRLAYVVHSFTSPHIQTSVTVRQQLWSIAFDLIRQHPWTGVGLGRFEPAYQQELHQRFAAGQPAFPEFVFRDPHNWILSFWLNAGLLGLVSFGGLNMYALWSARSQPKSKTTQALTLALVSLLLFGLVDTMYWKNDLAALHWLLLLCLQGLGMHEADGGTTT
jgi:O-antigen ligase